MWSWTKCGSWVGLAAVLPFLNTTLAGAPRLHAFAVEGSLVWLGLRAEDAGREGWARVGDDFDGYRIEHWNGATQTAILRRGDATFEVPLVPAAVRLEPAAGPVAETRGVLQNLHQLTVSACQWMIAQETSRVGIEQLVGPEQSLQQIESAAGESYAGLSFTATPGGVNVVMDGKTVPLFSGPERLAIQVGPTQSLTVISQRLGIPLERLAALNPGLPAQGRLAEWTSVRLH